jgi:hypothetical protein
MSLPAWQQNQDADELASFGRELRSLVVEWLKDNHPELVP